MSSLPLEMQVLWGVERLHEPGKKICLQPYSALKLDTGKGSLREM